MKPYRYMTLLMVFVVSTATLTPQTSAKHRSTSNAVGSISISIDIPIKAQLESAPTISWEGKADRVVGIATSLIGTTRYSHRYSPPYTMDGSGFTYYVYKRAGIDLGTRDDDRQANIGREVQRWKLRRGDLVFFSSIRSGSGRIGQVGIYIGHDQFIQIFEPGRTAVISRLNGSRWWSDHYVTARRVIW